MDANAADASPCSGNGGNCGPNAECKHEVSGGELSADTICVCKEGYTGDPDSPEGCSEHDPAHVARPGGQGQLTARGCVTPANNRTYQVGEQWFDACDYSCVCGEEQEIICQVRARALIVLELYSFFMLFQNHSFVFTASLQGAA